MSELPARMRAVLRRRDIQADPVLRSALRKTLNGGHIKNVRGVGWMVSAR